MGTTSLIMKSDPIYSCLGWGGGRNPSRFTMSYTIKKEAVRKVQEYSLGVKNSKLSKGSMPPEPPPWLAGDSCPRILSPLTFAGHSLPPCLTGVQWNVSIKVPPNLGHLSNQVTACCPSYTYIGHIIIIEKCTSINDL